MSSLLRSENFAWTSRGHATHPGCVIPITKPSAVACHINPCPTYAEWSSLRIPRRTRTILSVMDSACMSSKLTLGDTRGLPLDAFKAPIAENHQESKAVSIPYQSKHHAIPDSLPRPIGTCHSHLYIRSSHVLLQGLHAPVEEYSRTFPGKIYQRTIPVPCLEGRPSSRSRAVSSKIWLSKLPGH